MVIKQQSNDFFKKLVKDQIKTKKTWRKMEIMEMILTLATSPKSSVAEILDNESRRFSYRDFTEYHDYEEDMKIKRD